MRRGVFCLVQITAVIFTLLFFNRSINAQCVPPPSGMVAWWLLDEASGPTANDIAGSVNNAGTWMSSPVPVTGKVAGALSFSGSNSVDVPDDPELNFGTSDFSIDLWIKTTDASGTRTILDKRTGSVPNITGYLLFLVNGNLGSQIGDGAGYNNCVTTGFVADGNWHHAALTVDRNNPSGWLHYVDGSAVSPIANPTNYQGSLTNTAPFVMARNLLSPSQTFAGTLDEVELFNRVLDSSEIRGIWAADSLGKCKDTCHATGDANNNGLALTTADLVYLTAFINGCGPAPIPLYSCDLNGDGYVDPADLVLYQNYFIYGIGVFAPYGGYPVLCPCDPIPAPVPDSVRIFGIDHVSGGTACYDTTDGGLTVSRISMLPPDTLVDDNGDTIIVVFWPDKGRSGGGPYISSKSNLEDAGIAWSGDFKHDSTMQVAASFQVEAYGFMDGDSDQVIASTVETKQTDKRWALAVKAPVTSYTITAYLNGGIVWSQSDMPAGAGWFQIGRIGHTGKAESSGGPFGTSISNLEDAGIISIGWDPGDAEPGDTHVWSWEIHGIVNLAFDKLKVDGKHDQGVDVGYLTHIIHYAMNVPSFTINAESQSMDYGGIAITPLGDATVTPVDTTLVVSNIGSSGADGMDAEHDASDGEWAIVWKNPDPSGTLPVGASVGTEFFFATPTHPDSLSMRLSMTKAAANNWNLAVQSIASIHTIQAFNNGLSVFSVVDTDPHELGYIVETAKGVHPVGFNGGSTGKPAHVIASSDYDFTAAANGVQWTWAAHGVANLQIDYLSISTEVPGTKLFGVTHATMCGANGAKADPISFTILDIEVVPSYICGDADGSGAVNILDVSFVVSYLYKGGPAPNPSAKADVNHSGSVNILDVGYTISYLYKGGPLPNCP